MNRLAYPVLMAALLLLGCSSVNADEGILSIFRLLAPQGKSVIRVLTQTATCPTLDVDGQPQAMGLRIAPSTHPRSDQPSATFPLRVCELRDIPATTPVRWQGKLIPQLNGTPKKIVVLGDTGCRTKWPAFFQSCRDPQQWPLAEVAQQAAWEHPDAVIHVGDYAYRESPCTSQGCAGTPYGYGWDVWQADFFQPMAPLLAAAPWVVVRGNHESCARAGQGWFRLLDPLPYDEHHACLDAHHLHELPDPPYAVPLGEGLQWIVMDSTAVTARQPHRDNPIVALYAQQFATVSRLASQAEHNWLMMHHPILGYGYLPLIGFEPANPMLSAALAQQHYPGWTPPGIQLVLQGHVHTFELSTFKNADPVGLIAGFGGSMLEPQFPSWVPDHQSITPRVQLNKSVNDQHYGYLLLEDRGHGTWQLTEKSPQGALRRICQLALDRTPLDFQCQTPAPVPAAPPLPPMVQQADYLLLGEVHDNAQGHAWRTQWLQQLALAGPAHYVLALEQLNHDQQAALSAQQDQLGSRNPDETDLQHLAHAGGFSFKGWHWPFYAPVLKVAIKNQWPILATNLNRDHLMAIMSGTIRPPPTPLHWSEKQQHTLLKEIQEGHCNLLPAAQEPLMVSAQMARDKSMAQSMVDWHHRTGKPVILLAGNGHLRHDTAVPLWLHQLDPQAHVVSIAFQEPDQKKESDGKNLYDMSLEIPEQTRPDPCEALRQRLQSIAPLKKP